MFGRLRNHADRIDDLHAPTKCLPAAYPHEASANGGPVALGCRSGLRWSECTRDVNPIGAFFEPLEHSFCTWSISSCAKLGADVERRINAIFIGS